jgi:hypothetical protein
MMLMTDWFVGSLIPIEARAPLGSAPTISTRFMGRRCSMRRTRNEPDIVA